MIATRKITSSWTSVKVHAERGAALCVAKFRLPRLFFLSLMIFLALDACDLLFNDTFNPPKWIQGNWRSGTTAFSFSDDSFSVDDGYGRDRFRDMRDGSYDRYSSTQYVVHLDEIYYELHDYTGFHKGERVRDWTFTKLSATQIDVTGADSVVLTKF